MSFNSSTKLSPGKSLVVTAICFGICTSVAFAANPSNGSSQTPSPPKLTKAQREGKKLAFSRSKGNCLACHEIDDGDMPGTVGPKLVNVKKMIPKRSVLFKHIWDEPQFNPQTPMPPFGKNLILSKNEINKIIDYLYTQ